MTDIEYNAILERIRKERHIDWNDYCKVYQYCLDHFGNEIRVTNHENNERFWCLILTKDTMDLINNKERGELELMVCNNTLCNWYCGDYVKVSYKPNENIRLPIKILPQKRIIVDLIYTLHKMDENVNIQNISCSTDNHFGISFHKVLFNLSEELLETKIDSVKKFVLTLLDDIEVVEDKLDKDDHFSYSFTVKGNAGDKDNVKIDLFFFMERKKLYDGSEMQLLDYCVSFDDFDIPSVMKYVMNYIKNPINLGV